MAYEPNPNSARLRPWTSLPKKVVMVTGASSGIGREMCLDLAKAGCRIVAAARRVERLRSLCDQINEKENPIKAVAVAVELDISAGGGVIAAAVEKAWEAFGRIDVLVNNAGIRGNVHSPLDLPEEEWNNVFTTNVTGTWLVTKFVCRRMRDSNLKGSVVNISSIAGLHRGHLPGGLAYASSKTSLNTLTKIMALELGRYGIRVNCIAPGLFKSEITEALLQKKWIHEVAMRTIPLKTHGTSDPAITSLVRYLIDDSSDYVSGNIFIVDAGATLPGIPLFSML